MKRLEFEESQYVCGGDCVAPVIGSRSPNGASMLSLALACFVIFDNHRSLGMYCTLIEGRTAARCQRSIDAFREKIGNIDRLDEDKVGIVQGRGCFRFQSGFGWANRKYSAATYDSKDVSCPARIVEQVLIEIQEENQHHRQEIG